MAACLQILYRPLQPPIQHPSPFPGSAHGFASTSGSIRPWMVWGRGGRRREADKRIALSSRNDIFDQHFHITPAEALSRASLRSLTLRFFSFFPPFHPPFPANFSSHSARLFLVPPDPFDSFHPFALTLFILALLCPSSFDILHLALTSDTFFSSSFVSSSSSSSSRPPHGQLPLLLSCNRERLRFEITFGVSALIDSFIRRHSYYKSRCPI